ncbi:hypothetical protein QQX98_012848 [Neonectria punicea]|uniref:C2H2-type domain-containing protein n=1 Tax=Neonectria punicea TaxID=979145 RepID=A0ABR1GHY8_9HYPO
MIPSALPSSQKKMGDHTEDKASEDPTKSITQPSCSEDNNDRTHNAPKLPGTNVKSTTRGLAALQTEDDSVPTLGTQSNNHLLNANLERTSLGLHQNDSVLIQKNEELAKLSGPARDILPASVVGDSNMYWMPPSKLSEFLVNIGSVLTKEVLPKFGLDRTVQARVLKRLAKEASSIAGRHDKPLGEVSHSDSDSDEDNDSSKTGSDSEQSSESESDDMDDYALEIETDVECLLELDAIIRTPTLDLEAKAPGDLESVSRELRPIGDTFGSLFFVLIKDRFPRAPFDLAMPLSSAYMNHLREWKGLDDNVDDTETSITPRMKDLFPISEPYCPEKGKPRIPSIPIRFRTFKCPTCREYHRFSSDDAWQKHAFNDMKLWVCHEQECKRRSKPFTTAMDWASHLEFEHSYGPEWPSITCTFCGEKTDSGNSAICLHLDSHFKETCLDATEAVVRYQGFSTNLWNFKHTTHVNERGPSLNVEKVLEDHRGGVMSGKSGQVQSDVPHAIHLSESSKALFEMEELVQVEELTKSAKSKDKGKAIVDVVKTKDFSHISEDWSEQPEDWFQNSDDDLDLGFGSSDGSELEEVEHSTTKNLLSTIRNREYELSEPESSSSKRTAKPGDCELKPDEMTLAMPTSRLRLALRDDAQGSQDHTSYQPDERFPYDIDKLGEGKVLPDGTLLGQRKYKCMTFRLPSRGDRLFMLANECSRMLGYRRPRGLFDKAPLRFVISQDEKDLLVQQGFLLSSEGQVEIVTARSVFKQHGRYAIRNGRKFYDDYWEHRARLKEKEWERGRSPRGSPANSPPFDLLKTKPGYDAKQE